MSDIRPPGARRPLQTTITPRKPAELSTGGKAESVKNSRSFYFHVNEFEISANTNNFDNFIEIREAEEFWKNPKGKKNTSGADFFISSRNFERDFYRRSKIFFALPAVFVFLIIFGTAFAGRVWYAKNSVSRLGQDALGSFVMAQQEILERDFRKSSANFRKAEENFSLISRELNALGGILTQTTRYVPVFSRLTSGVNLAETGKNISRIGILAGEIAELWGTARNLHNGGETTSLILLLKDTEKKSREILNLLQNTEEAVAKVNIDDIPENERRKFMELKERLPEIRNLVAGFVDNSQVFVDILGGNGPRKYLFLFQNNHEMRATGGFIGTYGLLDIFNGHIRQFFIDGIFNPDGQLRERIVPPAPIQKISADWSLHDSNWFPDFPVSAEKAVWFYEKTGGPTVDGVITMTPVVMQKLLAITGPVDMPDYGVTVDSSNFMEKIQYEVEVNYDKKLNQPKKILADLAPKIMERVFNLQASADIAALAGVFLDSLAEKQILIYSRNYEIEKLLSALGWSGEILETEKDYLSVINTNINGFKTDGIVEEKIEHLGEIQSDGTVIDTVTITRHHKGGNSPFEWWNKVNANYMRVYVPRGSKLLSAEGQTREFNSPPLDYSALGYKRDAQLQTEESLTSVDPETGTRIYTDADKTVFANWVYVSPQESVTVKYRYLLPFKVDLDSQKKAINTYSLLLQKQSGSQGSLFVSTLNFPDGYALKWKYPEEAALKKNSLKTEGDLRRDNFIGAAFTK